MDEPQPPARLALSCPPPQTGCNTGPDNGEPGAGRDTFKIQTSSGYIAGGTLDNGNVQIHN